MPSRRLRTNGPAFPARDAAALRRVNAMFAVVSTLMTAAFLYASTVPLVFAVPDYRVRLAGIIAAFPTQSGRAFDWIANLLALIPLGFCWSAALGSRIADACSSRKLFCRAALGCLALAAFAEFVQLWLPLRVPSLRDLIALESGALLGCGLWTYLGARTIEVCCRMSQKLNRRSPSRHSRSQGRLWMTLFGALLAACLAINSWASPSECFQMYRQRTLSASSAGGAGGRRVITYGNILLSSTAAALALLGLCGLSVRALSRPGMQPAGGLRIFVPELVPQANPVDRALVAHHLAASEGLEAEKSASAGRDRAA